MLVQQNSPRSRDQDRSLPSSSFPEENFSLPENPFSHPLLTFSPSSSSSSLTLPAEPRPSSPILPSSIAPSASASASASASSPVPGGFTASQFAQHERRLRDAVPGEFTLTNPPRSAPIPSHSPSLSWSSTSYASLDEKRIGSSIRTLEEGSNVISFRSVTSDHQSDDVNSWPRGGYSMDILNQYLVHSARPPTRPQPAALKTRITFLAHSSKGSDSSFGLQSENSDVSSSVVTENSTTALVTVPDKRQGKVVRNLRHIAFSVYRRLFSIVFVFNMIGFVLYLIHNPRPAKMRLSDLSTAASANILVAILIRQDYIVNLLFRTCWMVPLTAPLRLRRILAKVYEHGGIHSGAAVCGTIWLLLLTVVLTINCADRVIRSAGILTVTYILLALLLVIIVCAYPRFRFMSHNSFEMTHRFAGWLAVGLFWVELVLVTDHLSSISRQSFGTVLIKEPTFWFLIIITFHIILPWLRLQQWEFKPELLSTHAVRLHFGKTLMPFSGLAISDRPLFEWHPFATFPAPNGEPGGSLIISDAGDWTKKTIRNPRTKYWVKGVPRTGVLSMAIIFQRVVVVTTGSGIGPCLSFLIDQTRRQPVRVLWSTPSPMKTFGKEICDTVRAVDPKAIIHDTRLDGRPNMVELTYQLFVESQAEAVFVISNPRLTRKIVYSMETRGVPAFGPIWDS